MLNGKAIFQHILMSLSYRNRGNVHRTHTNVVHINSVFTISDDAPKNIKEVKNLINIIIPYSLIKIIANNPLPYSMLNPDTISDSPSAKSNGVRLDSAIHIIIQIMKIGKNLIAIHIFSWRIFIIFIL